MKASYITRATSPIWTINELPPLWSKETKGILFFPLLAQICAKTARIAGSLARRYMTLIYRTKRSRSFEAVNGTLLRPTAAQAEVFIINSYPCGDDCHGTRIVSDLP